MIKLTVALCAAALAAAATGAHAQADQWGLDIQPGECTLNRSISTPAPVMVALRTVPGSNAYRLAILGKDLPGRPLSGMKAMTVQLDPAGTRFQHDGARVALDKTSGALVIKGLKPDFVTSFAQSASFGVTADSVSYGPYRYSQAAGAVKAFTTCQHDQLVEWGADPAQFAAGGKEPVDLKDRETWIPRADLLRMPMGASMIEDGFRVTIAADGRIDGCFAVNPKTSAEITRAACGPVISQRLFDPAKDAAGKPVRGVAIFQVQAASRSTLR